MTVLGERIYLSPEQVLAEVAQYGAAVAITVERLGEMLHTGVLLAVEGEEAQVLHLIDHKQLRCERWVPLKQHVFLLRPLVGDVSSWSDNLEVLAAFWERVRVRRTAGSWLFAFAPGASIDRDGWPVYSGVDDEHTPGFTCATFVLQLLEGAGYPLVRSHTWPPPDAADRAWQEEVVRTLQRYFPAHAFGMLDEVGAVPRYRPEQVACAAASDRHPATYEDVREVADCVARMIRAAS